MSLKLDSHQHFWKYDPHQYSWINDAMNKIRKDFFPEDLEPVLKQNGFDGCIAVQAAQSEEETEYLLHLAKKSSFIKGVVGWVDFSSLNLRQKLEQFSRNSQFKGVRHTVYDENGEFMLNKDFLKGIELLSEYNLTYDILAFDYQLPGAIEMVQKFPAQRFVLDHMGKPQISKGVSARWKRDIEELAKSSNVYCKLSGLVTETEDFHWEPGAFSPFLEVVFNAFGTDRVMFGSDWPVSLAASSYDDTVKIVEDYFQDHDDETGQKVFGVNAARFYNIKW